MKEISIKKFLSKQGYKPYVDITKKNAYTAVYDALLSSKQYVIDRTPVDTGLMASSWDIEKVSEDSLLFGNTAPYAYDVEYGRPAGKLSAEEKDGIRHWVARKLISKRPIDINSPEVQETSKHVINKIETKGIDPTYILTNAIEDEIKPKIEKNIEKVIKDKGINEFTEGF